MVWHGYSTNLVSKYLTGYSQKPSSSRLPARTLVPRLPWPVIMLPHLKKIMQNISTVLAVDEILLFWDCSLLSFVLKHPLTTVVTDLSFAWKNELAIFLSSLNLLHENILIHKIIKTWDHQIICKLKLLYSICSHSGERPWSVTNQTFQPVTTLRWIWFLGQWAPAGGKGLEKEQAGKKQRATGWLCIRSLPSKACISAPKHMLAAEKAAPWQMSIFMCSVFAFRLQI